MVRGTTPTIIFNCPFSIASATKLSIVFCQLDKIIFEKNLSDVTIDDDTISVHLTEQETLKFNSDYRYVHMQIRVEINSEKLASNIMRANIHEILREGEL